MEKQIEIDFSEIEKEVVKISKKKKKPTVSNLSQYDYDLLEHKKKLNQKPPDSFLKTNSFYGNKYVPIEISERILSALFDSYSFVVNIPPIVEEGNIIFFVNVIVKNPVTKEFETYTGTSSVPIKPINGTLRDIHPHIPAAKTFAIMNGCKHIGRLFRAENDDITNIFDSFFEKKQKEVPAEDKAKGYLKKRLFKMISNSKTKTSLKGKLKKIKELNDDEVNKAYENKLKELK